jgi:hypothetical protein
MTKRPHGVASSRGLLIHLRVSARFDLQPDAAQEVDYPLLESLQERDTRIQNVWIIHDAPLPLLQPLQTQPRNAPVS